MIIEDLVKKVREIDAKKNYWFVRTDSGTNFKTFHDNNFIGIGWNYITVEDLLKKKPNEVKEKIAKFEKLDISISKSKSKVTAIYNKLKTFNDLKKHDLIIIPSYGSSRYAFGIIEDSNTYVDIDQKFDCNYHKRKKVKWLTVRHVKTLDPMFYQIKVSRHSISKINRYDSYIDNVTNSLYLKEGFAHFVINIKTNKEINVRSLISFIDSLQSLSEEINNYFDLNENVQESSIKLNLQSPGLIEFKFPIGKALITLATVLSIISCAKPSAHPQYIEEIKTFIETKSDTLDVIKENIIELEVDKDRINSIE